MKKFCLALAPLFLVSALPVTACREKEQKPINPALKYTVEEIEEMLEFFDYRVREDGTYEVTAVIDEEHYLTKESEKIVVPDCVAHIGDSAFGAFPYLKEVTLPEGLQTIGLGAFEYCPALKTITIPDSVTDIGFCCFLNCFSLEEVTLGKGVKRIEKGAFHNCYELKTVNYRGSKKAWRKISIKKDNDELKTAAFSFDYTG